MKKGEKGFGLVEVVMAVVIVALLGGVVFLYVQTNQKKNQASPSTSSLVASPGVPVPTASPKIPSGWKTYINDKYKIAFSYPSDWSVVDLGIGDLGPTSAATDKSFYSIGFRRPQDVQGYATFNIAISHETLQQAVDAQKAIINREYPNMAIKQVLTNEKKTTVNGHSAVELDLISIPQVSSTKGGNAEPKQYSSFVFATANSLVYKIDMGLYDSTDALESSTFKQVLNTLQIK